MLPSRAEEKYFAVSNKCGTKRAEWPRGRERMKREKK
jgi:hypothetical protein